jgi:arsenate reductase
VGLQLLENSTATALGLVALILAFGPVSGAHFNPVVTLADRLLGGLDTTTALAYGVAQVVGGCVGAIVANLMFEIDAVDWSTRDRSSAALWLGEAVATFGLVTVILGVVRSGRSNAAPFAVAGYIGAAYWFTSSTSFANPAVTVARMLSDTFAGIEPASVPAFVLAQFVGGLLALGLAVFLHPALPGDADDIVVPHPSLDEERTT